MKRSTEDLLGPDPRKKAAPIEPDELPPSEHDMQFAKVMQGVGITWLHFVFKRDRNTVKELLRDCPVLRSGKAGAPIYDVAVAAQYLVKPKFDVRRILGTMKEQDLPPDLQPKIWEARLKRQRWEQRAGDLWHREDILSVFGNITKTMKETMQLWTDELGEVTVLTDAQRDILAAKVRHLQAELHRSLINEASTTKTPSQLAELTDEEDESEDDRDVSEA